MATELAAAYVTLIPSLKGAQSTISSQLSGMDFSSAGAAMGKSLSKGLGGSMDGFAAALKGAGGKASGLFSAIAKPAAGAIAAIGGSLAALTAQGGISRALKIEAAENTFKGLKFTAEQTASAMESANIAVKGTAFGLDSAAQAASLLATSGVGLGDDMTRSLQAIAGTAVMAGTNMEDITGIFQKVASSGKITGNELDQFNARGVNALSAIANYMGLTQEETRELVSAGKVGFREFADAMHAAYGEAAYGANETFSGAMMNVRAALSRVGEKFADPALDSLRRVFVAMIPAIDSVGKALSPLVSAFGDLAESVSGKLVAGIEKFTSLLQTSTQYDEFGNLTSEAVTLNDVIGALAGGLDAAFGEGTAAKIGQIASAVGLVGIAAGGLSAAGTGAGAMSSFISSMQEFGGSVSQKATAAVDGFKNKVASVKDALTPSASAVEQFSQAYKKILISNDLKSGSMFDKLYGFAQQVPNIKWAFGELGSATSKALTPFKAVGSVAAGFGSKFAGMAATVGKGAIVASGALGGVAVQMMGLGVAAAMGNADLQAMADGLLENMNALSANIGPVAEQAVSIIQNLVPQVTAALPGLIGAFGSALATIAQAIPQIMPEIVAALTTLVSELAPLLVSMAPMLLAAGMQLFTGLVQALAVTAPQLIAQLPALISSLLSTLLSNLPAMISAATQLFFGIMIGLVQATPQIVATLIAFIPQLVQTVISMAPMMLQGAVQLFRAIGQGLAQVGPMIGQALLDFVMHLPEILMSAVGGMIEAGGQLLGGLIDGFTGKAPAVDATATSIGTNATWSLMNASDWTSVGMFSTNTYMAGLNQPSITTAAQNIGNNAVNTMMQFADAFGVGQNINTTALAGLQASPFGDQAALMTSNAVDAAMAVDATPVGQQFSEQAAAGVDVTAMNAAVQEMVSGIAAMSADVHVGVDVDTSGVAVLAAAAAMASAAYVQLAVSASASMAQAAAAASAAGAAIRAAIDIPDKTVRVNVAPGYVSLPHFSISGSFDLKSMSVPTVGVSWYARGGVFTNPSIIGVGEGREPEGVFPLSWLEDKFGGGGNVYNITLDYSAGEDANQLVRDLGRAIRTSTLMEA